LIKEGIDLWGNKYFIIFLKKFASLINAGFPVTESMSTLSRETIHSKLRRTITALGKNMEKGSTLSESLSGLSAFFSPFFISLVRAGERAGNLDIVLNRFADFLEDEMILQKKIHRVMTYPFIMLTIALGVSGFIIIFLLPLFIYVWEPWYHPPLAIKLSMLCIKVTGNRYILHPVIIFIIALTVVIFKDHMANGTAKKIYNKIKLSIPFFAPLNRKIAISGFCRALALLIESNVPVLEALEIAGHYCDNEFITKKIPEVKEFIDIDNKIALPLASAEIFSPMIIQMVNAGEKSGNLYAALYEISHTYNNEIELMLEEKGKIIGCIIFVCIGLIVGYTVLALMPQYGLYACCH